MSSRLKRSIIHFLLVNYILIVRPYMEDITTTIIIVVIVLLLIVIMILIGHL